MMCLLTTIVIVKLVSLALIGSQQHLPALRQLFSSPSSSWTAQLPDWSPPTAVRRKHGGAHDDKSHLLDDMMGLLG